MTIRETRFFRFSLGKIRLRNVIPETVRRPCRPRLAQSQNASLGKALLKALPNDSRRR